AGWTTCAEVGEQGGGAVRRRRLRGADRASEEARHREARSGGARGRPGRTQPVEESRAGDRADRGAAPRGPEDKAAPASHEADRGIQGASAGAEAPTFRGQAAAPAALASARSRRASQKSVPAVTKARMLSTVV